MPKRGVLLAAALNAMLLPCAEILQADDTRTADTTAATPSPVPAKTGKERLSNKASDEQRVDNCNVPPDRQGTKVRPDACPQAGQKVPTS